MFILDKMNIITFKDFKSHPSNIVSHIQFSACAYGLSP